MYSISNKKEIVTQRLTIRRIEAEDWRGIQRIWEDFKQTEYLPYDTPKDTADNAVRQKIKRWADASRSGIDHIYFVSCLGKKVIGFISMNVRPDGYETGYGFLNAYQGYGYAQESMNAVIEYMRSIGSKRIFAGTAMKNLPSVSLLERLDFKCTRTERISFCKDEFGEDIVFEGGIFEKEL